MRIILALTWVVLLSSSAWAMTIDPGFDKTAYQDGGVYYPSPLGQGGGMTSFMQGDGVAGHFNVFDDLFIESIDFSGYISDWDSSVTETGYFDLIFYSDDQVVGNDGFVTPELNSRFFSKRFEYTEGDGYSFTTHNIPDVNLALSKGDYWLAFENGRRGTVVGLGGVQFLGAHTPEPATWAMLILGIGGAIFARRKRGSLST